MALLDLLKLDCESFLSKLHRFNREDFEFDEEIIHIFIELAVAIDAIANKDGKNKRENQSNGSALKVVGGVVDGDMARVSRDENGVVSRLEQSDFPQPMAQTKPAVCQSNGTMALVRTGAISKKSKVSLTNVRIDAIVKSTADMFAHAKVYLYGSHLYGIVDDDSDVNIFVDFENGYFDPYPRARNVVRNLFFTKAREQTNVWKNVESHHRNDYHHIIKAVHTSTGASCAFTFSNGFFVEKSKRLQEFIEVLPMIRDLVQFLKLWQLPFSTFQLTSMVLWYFQYRCYLPSIERLQKDIPKILCGGAQVNISQPIKLLKPIENGVEELAADFFEVFGNEYVPQRDVICLHSVKLIRRKCDSNDSMIGEMMAPKAEAFMYVLDMFTPKNSNHRVNIMANITQNALQCFLANCTITSATYLPEHLPSIVIGNAIDRQIKEIVNNVTETFDKSRVYLYGSRLYLLNYDGSDVNIYVDINDSYHQLVGKVKMSEQQTMISQMLQKYPQKWTNIKHTIRSNLYPLVTAVDKASNLTCSFSLANGSFMERSKRLSEIIDAMPIIRVFVRFLANWQSTCDGFHFTSFQLTIFVVWYFQYRNYLPSISALQSGDDKFMCGDAQVNFNQPITLLKPQPTDLNHIVEDFFDIFANQYEPERHVICPHFGKLLPREMDKKDLMIDSGLAKFYTLMENAKLSLWNPPTAYLYVHDMFLHNLCPNITADITCDQLRAFRQHCQSTHDELHQARS